MAYLRKGAEPPKKGKGSRPSQKMINFVNEYFVDFVATNAVVRAGYKCGSPRQVNRLSVELMNHPHVINMIDERNAERKEKSELTAQYVLNKLQAIVESTEGANPQAALRGLELIGKHLGMYKDRQEISGPDGGAIEMEQRTKERVNDFTRRIARLASTGTEGNVLKFPDGSGEG